VCRRPLHLATADAHVNARFVGCARWSHVMLPKYPVIAALGGLALSSVAHARPSAPEQFCVAFADAPVCAGHDISCSYCHTSTAPVAWNSYGIALLGALNGKDFDAYLGQAVSAIAADDADGDGMSNGDEQSDGTLPGDASSTLLCVAPETDYDFERAYRRVSVLYCGQSPSYEDKQTFARLKGAELQRQALSEQLDACLDSDYWRKDGLQRLADVRIRPVQPVGKEGTPAVIIGDYEWDYRLWTYVLTDDRDMRELLTADYHVVEDASGKLLRRTGVFSGDGIQAAFSPLGQRLEPERRAGMITTTWFFAVNTMFSSVPRTTAAQAYRAYLGQDLALQDGVHVVPNEPADIDGRGVAAPVCRDCHSTLDPMSYAFIWYEGIRGPATGTYNTTRARGAASWADNQGMLLGEPIKDAKDWARVAIASDLFPRNLASIFMRHAIERDVAGDEEAEFEKIWRAIPDDGWSANRLIHRIVESPFFGGQL
jgi:hypothetical protein